MNTSSQAVYSLYRIHLRQVRTLPHSYLRLFFTLKARDDIEKILSFKGPRLRSRNLKTFSKLVRRIQRANSGDVASFQHLLDLAYGRKGKLKWELLEPILYSKGPLPDRIISNKENSRPPLISQKLMTLLTSSYSRTTKPMNKKDVERPRDLPTRADPSSEEARILGPFSKRREVNIRRRFFNIETRKLLPPVDVRRMDTMQQGLQVGVDLVDCLQIGLLADTERVIGEVCRSPTKTRRERRDEASQDPAMLNDRHPSRWVRRRYRWLLSRLPQLVCYGKDNSSISVQISSRSFFPYHKTLAHMPKVDSTTLSWVQMPADHDHDTDMSGNKNNRK